MLFILFTLYNKLFRQHYAHNGHTKAYIRTVHHVWALEGPNSGCDCFIQMQSKGFISGKERVGPPPLRAQIVSLSTYCGMMVAFVWTERARAISWLGQQASRLNLNIELYF
jgi:hypothetical protein